MWLMRYVLLLHHKLCGLDTKQINSVEEQLLTQLRVIVSWVVALNQSGATTPRER